MFAQIGFWDVRSKASDEPAYDKALVAVKARTAIALVVITIFSTAAKSLQLKESCGFSTV